MTPSRSRRCLLAHAAGLLLSRVARADDASPAPSARAPGPDHLADLLARVARARARVRTLQGPFEQTRTIGLLATDVRSRGTLTLVRPDRLRWELLPPDDVTFWVGPEGLAYRDPHGHGRLPASEARAASSLADLRTLLGGDLSGLRERWDMRVLRDDAGGAELQATPRPGADAHLEELRLALSPDLLRPTRVLLVEGARDRTVVEFGALAVNVAVDEQRMRPPP